jgi:hypothetical protein
MSLASLLQPPADPRLAGAWFEPFLDETDTGDDMRHCASPDNWNLGLACNGIYLGKPRAKTTADGSGFFPQLLFACLAKHGMEDTHLAEGHRPIEPPPLSGSAQGSSWSFWPCHAAKLSLKACPKYSTKYGHTCQPTRALWDGIIRPLEHRWRACLRGTAPHDCTVRHSCTFLQPAQKGWRCSPKGRLIHRAQWLFRLTRPRRRSPAALASISSPWPLMMRNAQWLVPASAKPTTAKFQAYAVSRGRRRGAGHRIAASAVRPQHSTRLPRKKDEEGRHGKQLNGPVGVATRHAPT